MRELRETRERKELADDREFRDRCAVAVMPQWSLVLPAAASPALIAEWSYGMADAMIAERNRRDRRDR